MTRFFGAHVSAAGGLENAVKNSELLGVNTVQIHPSPPQRWTYKPFAEGVEEQFLSDFKASSVLKKIFFHGIYLINLATPDEGKLKLARQSLKYYLDLASRMGAEGVIFHVGSNKDNPDAQDGIKQAALAIDEILLETPVNSKLLLEVSAGAGSIIGKRLEELSDIYSRVKDQSRVEFALDTQHMWASGYNWKENLEEIIENIDSVFTLKKVAAIHLNDSMTECGSKKDRHANLGEGLIGRETIEKILNHDKLKSIPFILETPALKDIESAKVEVEVLRSLVKE